MSRRLVPSRLRFLAPLVVLAATLISAGARAEDRVVPSVRVGAGPAFHVSPRSEAETTVAFDATAGALFLVGKHDLNTPGLILTAGAGYAYDGIGLHAGALVGSLGWGHALLHAAWQPRLLVGAHGADGAVGTRNGLVLNAVFGLVGLEAAHQVVWWSGAAHHSVQTTLSVDVGLIAFAFVRAASE